jgi:PKHD-type hydroxylase
MGRLFSAEESAQIIGEADRRPIQNSLLTGAESRLIRNASLIWLRHSADTVWIFDRLTYCVHEWNKRFEIELSQDPPRYAQLTRYVAGQQYDWHMDLGRGKSSLRRVSIVVALNDADEYDGGGLEFFYGSQPNPLCRLSAGEAVLFPSYVMHRAAAVLSGIRWTLAVLQRED